jgi:thiosulfate/3-mercaptopyruvate sulfurtransferase
MFHPSSIFLHVDQQRESSPVKVIPGNMRILWALIQAMLFLFVVKPTRAWIGLGTRFASLLMLETTPRRRSSHATLSLHTHTSNLLSVEQCLNLYNSDDNSVRFIDGSWYHKGSRNGRSDFEQGPRIPTSIYFDMNDIAASKELFPHLNPTGLSQMQPPTSLFAAFMDACGITSSDHVIIYGRDGCAFLPRIWFTFRHVMGHERVSLMQGSLNDWMEAGGPVDTERLTVPIPRAKDLDLTRNASYQATYKNDVILDLQEMKAIVAESSSTDAIILDTRGSSFAYGHMPGAIHVPYSSLHAPGYPNRFKPVNELRDVLQAAGIGYVPSKNRLVVTCGSGVSVCSLYLAMEECGLTTETTAVYDGSWEEWGSLDNVPKVIPEKPTTP